MNIDKTLEYILGTINIENAKLSKSYYYNSIVFCIIDAIYSIGARYASTIKTVERYCNKNELQIHREYGSLPVNITDEHGVEDYLKMVEEITYLEMAEDLFENRQRTSTRNGILKAQAIYEFASILYKYNINFYGDIEKLYKDKNVHRKLKNIKGQNSGISLNYFFMLTGDENKVKPDRHIINYFKEATGKNLSHYEIEILMGKSVSTLKNINSNLTIRSLDHAIWAYMSSR